MTTQYDQLELHKVTKNPTKFEQNLLSGFRGVAAWNKNSSTLPPIEVEKSAIESVTDR